MKSCKVKTEYQVFSSNSPGRSLVGVVWLACSAIQNPLALPLSAVHEGYPVVFITASGDEMMMINNVNEVTVRGGRAISLAAQHPVLQSNVHDYLVVPDADRYLWPILATVPAQFVAYHMSVARGIDLDFPRNLSKTLTVD